MWKGAAEDSIASKVALCYLTEFRNTLSKHFRERNIDQ